MLGLGTSAAMLWGALAAPTGTAAQGATPAASPAACPAATAAELARIGRAWSEDALGGGDPSVLDDLLSPDLVHHTGTLEETVDAAGLRRVQEAVIAAFPEAEWTVDLVLTDAPWVVTRWTATGVHEGELQGIPPTGETATWEGINVFRVECGEIAEVWSEMDALGLRDQLGLSSQVGTEREPPRPRRKASASHPTFAAGAAAGTLSLHRRLDEPSPPSIHLDDERPEPAADLRQ